MSGFLARRMALAGAKSLRGAFGKLIKQPKIKPKKAGDLVNKPSKAGKLFKKATEVFPFVGAKSPKKVPLKNTKATTIRGVNIGTKAGKKFGETVKNQPKRIAGQDPVGRKPREMNKGGGFPDLSGDGKTTMKDILIGRGVIKKKGGGLVEATNKLKAQGLNLGGESKKIVNVKKNEDGSVTTIYSDKSMKKVRDGKVVQRGGPLTPKMKKDFQERQKFRKKEVKPFVEGQDDFLNSKKRPEPFRKIRKTNTNFKNGGAVRGKARGMGAATKGGGYNI